MNTNVTAVVNPREVTEDPLLKDYQAMAAMGPITGDDGAARALAAKELARELAATAKAIRERYEPHITKARAALDGLRGERDEYVSRYADAVVRLKQMIDGFLREKRKAEEQKALRRQLEREKEVRRRQQAEVEQARALGMTKRAAVESAKSLIQSSIDAARAQTAVEISSAGKVDGISARETWHAVVTDPKAVLGEIIAGNIPIEVVSFRQAELDRLARSWRDSRKFNGVVFESRKKSTL